MKVEHRLDGVSKSKVPIKIVRDIPKQKNKDLSRVHCYNCNKDGHLAKDCHNPKKRKHEASTIDVDEEAQHEEIQALIVHDNKEKGKGKKVP